MGRLRPRWTASTSSASASLSDATGVLLANLTPARVTDANPDAPHQLRPTGEVVLVRMLDVDTAVNAAREPDAFYASGQRVELRDRWLALELGPYAVAIVLGKARRAPAA